ncbi:MAG: LysR substrate-binding domain-containing protein [Polyangiaceae bacterium]
MRALPNLTGLVAFEAVARHRSFSGAGRELHITQGAISHRIRSLEEELGVRLLDRNSRNVEVTTEGAVLQRATADAFSRLRQGLEELANLRSGSRLTVSCSPSFAIRWLVPHLGSLREVAPDLDIHIAAQDELVPVGASDIDVCIRFGPGGYSGWRAQRLLGESITPVCSPAYASRLRLRTPADLKRCELLHDDVLAEHPTHVGWAEWLTHAGQDARAIDPTRGTRFSHAHLALDAAAAGQGVALGRRAVTAAARRAGLLVAPFPLSLPSRLTYWLLAPRVPRRPESVKRFRAWLVAALASDGAPD